MNRNFKRLGKVNGIPLSRINFPIFPFIYGDLIFYRIELKSYKPFEAKYISSLPGFRFNNFNIFILTL